MLRPATAQELPIEQAIFTEAWNMIKTYRHIDAYGNEKEWRNILEWTHSIVNRTKGNPALETLSTDMSATVLNYLEHVGQQREERQPR